MIEYNAFKAAADALGAVIVNEDIRPGDMYLGGRNSGIKVLTCRTVVEDCVYPVEAGYAFYTYECIKIIPR